MLVPFQIWLAGATPGAARPVIYVLYGILYGPALAMFTTFHSIF